MSYFRHSRCFTRDIPPDSYLGARDIRHFVPGASRIYFYNFSPAILALLDFSRAIRRGLTRALGFRRRDNYDIA